MLVERHSKGMSWWAELIGFHNEILVENVPEGLKALGPTTFEESFYAWCFSRRVFPQPRVDIGLQRSRAFVAAVDPILTIQYGFRKPR